MRRVLWASMALAVGFAPSAPLCADEAAKAGDVDAKVKKLIADGGNYYSLGQFDKAASCADEALRIKPESAAAMQLKEMSAEQAKGKSVSAKKGEVEAYRDAVVTEVERDMAAPREVLKMPGNWEEIKKRRAGTSGEGAEVAKQNEAIEKLLDSTTVDLKFDNPTSLKEAVEYLATLTKVNIMVDPRAQADGKRAEDAEISLKTVTPIKLRSALNLMARAHKLSWTVRDEMVFITDAAHLEEMKVTVAYDIRDLMDAGYDYPSDRDFDMSLPAVNARAIMWDSWRVPDWWALNGAGVFTGTYFAESAARKRPAMTEDDIRELVEQLLEAEDAKGK